jgi:hypothetical protein
MKTFKSSELILLLSPLLLLGAATIYSYKKAASEESMERGVQKIIFLGVFKDGISSKFLFKRLAGALTPGSSKQDIVLQWQVNKKLTQSAVESRFMTLSFLQKDNILQQGESTGFRFGNVTNDTIRSIASSKDRPIFVIPDSYTAVPLISKNQLMRYGIRVLPTKP